MILRRYIIIGLSLTLLLAVLSCDIFINHNGNNNLDNHKTVPEPDTVAGNTLPVDAENLYFMVITGDNIERIKDGPKKVLQELLDQRFDLRLAWYPNYPTPCYAPTAAEALVVQLKERNKRIVDWGFTVDPDPFIVNCGIDSFQFYQFDE